MQAFLTLVAPAARPLSDSDKNDAARALETKGAAVGDSRWLNPSGALEIAFEADDPDAVSSVPVPEGVDSAVTGAEHRRKKVLIADMDSTMIEIETLDTLAAELGFGEAVADITARSMNGELDFAEALRERVAMLADHPADAAIKTVMDRVTYSPGGKQTVATMRANGAYCALVSGGFTFTTETVHAALGFNEHRANVLEIRDGRLTGAVEGPIVSRDTKLETLQELCGKQGVGFEAACTVGDGANDLDMLKAAGLGVAYYGKPVVRQEARYRIDHTDLTSLLYFQGYHRDEFAAAE